jgi:hypothetical protein
MHHALVLVVAKLVPMNDMMTLQLTMQLGK